MYGTSEKIKRVVTEPIHWGSLHPSAGNPLVHKRADWSPIEIGIVGYMCSNTFKVTSNIYFSDISLNLYTFSSIQKTKLLNAYNTYIGMRVCITTSMNFMF